MTTPRMYVKVTSMGCMMASRGSCSASPPRRDSTCTEPLAKVAYLKECDAGIENSAFSVVALSSSGDTLAVGEAGSLDALGGVFTYERNAGTWHEGSFIAPSTLAVGDNFGCHVSMSADGTTLAVSACNDSSNAAGINGTSTGTTMYSGAVYLFAKSGSDWVQQAFIKAPTPAVNSFFGSTIGLSPNGNFLLVANTSEQAFYTYTRSGSTWTALDRIVANITATVTAFAFSADGNTVVIETQGSVLAYSFANPELVLKIGILATEGGSSIALSPDGKTLAINEFQNGPHSNGTVHIYAINVDTLSYSLKATLTPSNDTGAHGGFMEFGTALSFGAGANGQLRLVAGAPGESNASTGVNGMALTAEQKTHSGAAYVFEGAGTTWSQVDYIKASNSDEGDEFGAHVAISADGTTIAIGAPIEASNATGINGDETDNSLGSSGAVYLYDFTSAMN